MNSYPHEFLAHPQPLMFVAGLSSQKSNRDRSASILSANTTSSRRGSVSRSAAHLSAAPSAGLSFTSPLVSPALNSNTPLPNSPPVEDGQDRQLGIALEAGMEKSERDREFDELVDNLRGALVNVGGKGKVWLAEKDRKDFRILLVDKNVRLPMRKIAPQPSPGTATPVPHSPLSPLTTSSPLYPDGLIAPVWVRKHAELIPSVFVLFLRLAELGVGEEDKKREKESDEALVREIGERRRKLGERGIKLTVVLMASAETLDSPTLDPRLSYLRRSSSLSSKASLFVLTPVPADQLPDFVQSLQEALYDSAMEYYATHAKRVRRKRARVPSGVIGGGKLGLGTAGWIVRYEWKAGWFAELRGEMDVARRHYEDCWNELARMFSSTQVLPPRTKRWAEAKVLADCVAVRICRLLLYDGESPKTLGPFFVHMKRFGDLSRGWGIGEDTFEFWSWVARQYRVFAELLELATLAGVSIPPFPLPVLPVPGSAQLPIPSPLEYYTIPTSATNPMQILQQPAFYFYTAACCNVERQKRYQVALEAEAQKDTQESEASAASGYVSTAPGFANEKKVDHPALIIELFTKAYSLLKEHEQTQDRVALYVAYRIAETYCQSGQHEMAMRFFERISDTYKQDKWLPIARQIRNMWYECAQRTGAVETAVRLLIEMMGASSGIEGEERAALQDDLLSLLKTTAPSSTEPIVMRMEHDEALLDIRSGFWQPSSYLPDPAAFQVVIACPETVAIGNLPITALQVSFSDGRPDVIVNASTATTSDHVDLGDISLRQKDPVEGYLTWTEGRVLVLSGRMLSDSEGEVQISSITLMLEEGSWDIQLVFTPLDLLQWHTPKGSIIPVHDISSSVTFTQRPHDVQMDVAHHASAFVEELLELKVSVKSSDSRGLDVELSIFLQPGDEDESDATISVDEQSSTNLIKDISLGRLGPGETVERVVYLQALRPGTRVLDFSLHTSAVTLASPSLALPGNHDNTGEEHTQTVVVPVLAPFTCTSTIAYKRRDAVGEGIASITSMVTAPGPRAVWVESMELKETGASEAVLVGSSLASPLPGTSLQIWNQATEFGIFSRFLIQPLRRLSIIAMTTASPAEVIIRWRSAEDGKTIETRLPLPPVYLPPQRNFLAGTLHPPSSHTANLNDPFSLSLQVMNSHPSQSIADLRVQVETSENFVWLGARSLAIPELQAGEVKWVRLEVVAVGRTGWVALPGVKLWEGEGENRREVKVEVKEDRDARIFIRPS